MRRLWACLQHLWWRLQFERDVRRAVRELERQNWKIPDNHRDKLSEGPTLIPVAQVDTDGDGR